MQKPIFFLQAQGNHCKECNKRFVSVTRLEIHQKKYHGGGGSGLGQRCKECKRTFDSKKILLDHKCGGGGGGGGGAGDKPAMSLLECPQCELKFKEQVVPTVYYGDQLKGESRILDPSAR